MDTLSEARVRLDVPPEEYHRRELGTVTTGALKAMRRTPAHYRAWVETPDRPADESPALAFGRAVHAAVLEFDRFREQYVIEPAWGDRRRKAERDRYRAWKAQANGREPISGEDFLHVAGIVKSLHEHPLIGRLLAAEYVAEATVEWIDPETGLPCKCRPDWWARGGMNLMVDVKTTQVADAGRFAWSCRDYGYDLQVAHYTAGAEAVGERCDFIFAAVEKEPPYAVAVYQIDESAIDEARDERRAAMLRIAECVETGEWPGYPSEIQTLYLPRRKR